MNSFHKIPASDDEDDLELLRLKALETLRRKNAAVESPGNIHMKGTSPDKLNQYGRNKRRRPFGPHQGRGGKIFQGHFNRVRNTNLISITPVSDQTNVEETSLDRGTKLTLSNRFSEKQNTVGEGTSKFNRYDNSDKSDTESEEEEEESDSEAASPGKLERADSLEALMQELDDEIQGKPKAKDEKQANGDKSKTKKTKKKKRLTSDSDHKNTDSKTDTEQSDKNVEVAKPDNIISTKDDESKEPVNKENDNTMAVTAETAPATKENTPRKRQRSRSPFNRRNNFRLRRAQAYPNTQHHMHMAINQFQQQMPPMYPIPPYNQMYLPPMGNVISQPPPFFERPISPLSINTESLTTATLAPLSPRSAAFVLQNKAIIEKRKRSPRRSYSRSFSRSLSRSPRRSLTPPRRLQRRSISPRRLSRSPRRFSPRRRSLSPKRKSLSPRRRNAGKRDNSPMSRHAVRNRLGNKSGHSEDNKAKDVAKEKEKEKLPAGHPKEEVPLNPVLEARRRKFESNQLGKKAGIIRLKPKKEKLPEATVQECPSSEKEQASAPVSTEDNKAGPIDETNKDSDEFRELEKLLNEDLLLESDDFIDHKVEDIFSDEESNSDNEGRFKVKQKDGEKVTVLSYSKLMNGVKEEVKSEPLQTRNDRYRGRHSSSRYSERRRRTPTERKVGSRKDDGKDRREIGRERREVGRERKEVGRERKAEERESKEEGVPIDVESQEKSSGKQRISLKKERLPPSMDKRFERKIEIKIKNPSKYERGKERTSKTDDKSSKAEKVIEIETEDETVVELKDEVGSENVEEIEEGDNLAVNEGDLRAQLSRKRAGKLHKAPSEEVSSRILQFALQGAVYRKTKKKSKDKNITESEFAAVRNVLHADCIPRNLFVSLGTKRKVQLCKAPYKYRKYMDLRHGYRRPDGKLPIHLRLGLANQTEIFEDVKVKRKSRKRKSREVLEQV